MNVNIVYGFLTAIVVGFVCVLWFIGPLLAEFWGIILVPIGELAQWVACRMQEIARRLWDAGRKMERDGKLIRRIS